MSQAAITFWCGIVALAFFFWYIAAESQRRKRLIGTILTVILLALCLESAYPVKDKIRLGLDLQGGTSFLLQLGKEKGDVIEPHVLDQAVGVIRKRIDKFGVSEPVITPQGTDRILVQIPGMEQAKIDEAREQLQKVAKLELKFVYPDNGERLAAFEAGQARIPDGYEIKGGEADGDGRVTERLLVKKVADIDGSEVKGGHPFIDDVGGWGVSLQFKPQGAELFGKLTAANIGKRFAIMLDGVVQSAPVIQGAIYGGNASITGRFTEAEARTLSSVLENPLAVPVQITETRSASSTLGQEAIRNGILSGIGGLAFVCLIVLVFYRLAGLIAVIGLIINMALLVGVMAMFGFVLTLPGIAGVILSIGLAVDANVLIYERLREELAAGKNLTAAIQGAFTKAFTVIFDANVTTLIMAGILFWQATGPVRGFAVTLTIGVIITVFTSMIVGRTSFSWASHWGLKKITMFNILPEGKTYDFMGKRRYFLAGSVALFIAGAIAFGVRGEKNFGIDFRGGDLLVLQAEPAVEETTVRDALNRDDLVVQKEREGRHEFITVRSPLDSADEILTSLKEKLPEVTFTEEGRDRVGTIVGSELARNSLIALGLGVVGMIIFVSIRFDSVFALGAVVAMLHDILITIGIFALAGRELSVVMIGAILTIAGYSNNDTIVIFDRIRETLRSGVKGTPQELVNRAINETLGRTILTGGTSLAAVLGLYIWGGAVLNDFAFVIIVGIIVGTYSSIFVASSIVLWWTRHKGIDALMADNVQEGDATVIEG